MDFLHSFCWWNTTDLLIWSFWIRSSINVWIFLTVSDDEILDKKIRSVDMIFLGFSYIQGMTTEIRINLWIKILKFIMKTFILILPDIYDYNNDNNLQYMTISEAFSILRSYAEELFWENKFQADYQALYCKNTTMKTILLHFVIL